MNFKSFALLPLIAALAACGGGGGEEPSTAPSTGVPNTPNTPNTPSAPLVPSLVTSVPAATYSVGSQEAAAFATLNAKRQSCGFGKVAQSAALDVAARGHADWILINGSGGHSQILGTQGLTGVNVLDRIVSAGYSRPNESFFNELIVKFFESSDAFNLGDIGIRLLLNAPYHSIGLLDGHKDFGISARNTNMVTRIGASPAASVLVINSGYKVVDKPQLIGPDDVETYPCQGSTGVMPGLYGESPNPVPGRDLAINPLGTSIILKARQGQQIVISSAKMTVVATGAPVTLRTPNNSKNDPNPGFLKAHQAYVSADAPLVGNTQYRTIITGTNAGVAFTKDFTFTTSISNNI